MMPSFKKIFLTRLFTENMLAFLLQYIGLSLSTLASQHAPLWLASGTACAFIFMRGWSISPGIWLGSVFAYSSAKSGLGLAFLCATIITLQPLILLWISYRYIYPTLIFYRNILYAKFILVTLLLTLFTSLLLTLCCYSALQTAENIYLLWMQWWLANFNSILIFSSAIIIWEAYFPALEDIKKINRLMLGFLYSLLAILSIFAFLNENTVIAALIFAATFPVIILISWRFGRCAVITGMFLLMLVFALAVSFEAPLFTVDQTIVIFLQLFLSIETIAGIANKPKIIAYS